MKPLNTLPLKIIRLFVSCGARASIRILATWLLVGVSGTAPSSLACSVLAVGQQAPAMVGANYDWRARGGVVFLSPRGQLKSASFAREIPHRSEWTSQYASLTLSQFGRDFPMQGLNEQGLAGMVLVGPSTYPRDGALGAVTENLWLQYQLDHFKTVAEVEVHLRDLGIHQISASLHWFMCDATHDCAVIEFLAGQGTLRRGRDLPVRALTNTSYEQAMSFYSRWQETSTPKPEGYASSARFVRLAERRDVRSWLDLAETLDQVSLAGFTAWQSLFDLNSKSLVVRLDGGAWRSVSFANLPVQCAGQLPMMNLESGTWQDYDHAVVANLFANAAFGAPELGPAVQSQILQASERVTCDATFFYLNGVL